MLRTIKQISIQYSIGLALGAALLLTNSVQANTSYDQIDLSLTITDQTLNLDEQGKISIFVESQYDSDQTVYVTITYGEGIVINGNRAGKITLDRALEVKGNTQIDLLVNFYQALSAHSFIDVDATVDSACDTDCDTSVARALYVSKTANNRQVVIHHGEIVDGLAVRADMSTRARVTSDLSMKYRPRRKRIPVFYVNLELDNSVLDSRVDLNPVPYTDSYKAPLRPISTRERRNQPRSKK
jgi:hypothetical protein